MGFEYKIATMLSGQQTDEIRHLLETSQSFHRKYKFDNKIFWDFRQPDNLREMPNNSIAFENDGIYICQNNSSFVWTDLDELKNYLDEKAITFEIIDYQE